MLREKSRLTPATLTNQQARQTLGAIAGHPSVDRIRFVWPQQTLPRHGVRSGAIGDLEQGAGTFPHIGLGMAVHRGAQFLALLVSEI